MNKAQELLVECNDIAEAFTVGRKPTKEDDLKKKWLEAGVDVEGNPKHLKLVRDYLKFEKTMRTHVMQKFALEDKFEKFISDAKKLGFSAIPTTSGGLPKLEDIKFSDFFS